MKMDKTFSVETETVSVGVYKNQFQTLGWHKTMTEEAGTQKMSLKINLVTAIETISKPPYNVPESK